MFLVGLVDDVRSIKPYSKLLWQIVAAVSVPVFGLQFGLLGNDFIEIPLTVLWIVGITNAVNLLDNMDGLAGGIVFISLISFACLAFESYQPFLMPISIILAASIGGFLVFNMNPARIFMGDAGSLFLGFSVATLALAGNWKTASNALITQLGPILILSIPIFDTLLVSLNRMLSGRSVAQGGRDHSSHRLVALGLSERRAVGLLLLTSALLSAITIVSFLSESQLVLMLGFIALVGFIVFGMYLSELNVYEKGVRFSVVQELKQYGAVRALLHYKQQVFEIVVDTGFIAASFYLAFVIKYDAQLEASQLTLVTSAGLYVLLAKLAALVFFDPYRHNLRYLGIYELIQLFKATFSGSLAAAIVLMMALPDGEIPPSIFVIDWMLTFLLLSGYRLFVRIIDEYLFSLTEKSKNILIVGASGFGEAFVRFLKTSRSRDYHPVGFLDENKGLHGKRIGGVKVIGSPLEIEVILEKNSIDEIIFMDPAENSEVFSTVNELCRSRNIAVKRAMSVLHPVH